MSTPDETWTELRYRSRQVLTDDDGIADELDPITWWDLEAVSSGLAGTRVLGRGAVAVLDLARPAALARAVTAWGGTVQQVAAVLLDAEGRLAPGLDADAAERVLVFLGVAVTADGAGAGLPLQCAVAVRRRLAGAATLIASYPQPHTEDAADPAFLAGVPAPVRAAWFARGLRHVGAGVWTLAVGR